MYDIIYVYNIEEYIHTCMHAYMHAYIHASMHASMHTYICKIYSDTETVDSSSFSMHEPIYLVIPAIIAISQILSTSVS